MRLNVSPTVRRIGVNVLIVVILAVMLWCNLPESPIKRLLRPVLYPVAMYTGLEQYWTMFAPEPPRTSARLTVFVEMADGKTRTWWPPYDGGFFSQFVWCRWQKVRENAEINPAYRAELAEWVAQEVRRAGERPVRVRMTVNFEPMIKPGGGLTETDPETVVYDARVTDG